MKTLRKLSFRKLDKLQDRLMDKYEECAHKAWNTEERKRRYKMWYKISAERLRRMCP